MSPLLIALGAMFLQQTFASVGKVLPAVVAPLVIAELDADPAWVGVYYGIAAAAALFAQMGCGSFYTSDHRSRDKHRRSRARELAGKRDLSGAAISA